MTAILWVWKPPAPQLAASTMLEAADWCCAMLSHAKIPLSPELESWRERERNAMRGQARQTSSTNEADTAATLRS